MHKAVLAAVTYTGITSPDRFDTIVKQ